MKKFKNIIGLTILVLSSSTHTVGVIADTNISTQTTNNQQSQMVVGGNVTSKYIDSSGNELSGDVVKTGNVGESFTTEQKDINGYYLKGVQGNTSGTFIETPQKVTYIYEKIPIFGAPITVDYVDMDGNKIGQSSSYYGVLGENYTTDQKIITGYSVKEVKGNASGLFTNQAQKVTYVYNKIPQFTLENEASYSDIDGKELLPTINEIIKPGENWKFGEAKDIPGYTLDLQKSEVDLDGVHSSLQDMLNGLSVNLKDFLNYINSQVFSGNVTAEKQYIHFVYTKNPVKAENVTVNYVDAEGKAIPNASSQTISGNIGDSYDATTDKYRLAIAGYTLDEKKLPSNAKGTLSDQAQVVTYVYNKIPQYTLENETSYSDIDGKELLPTINEIIKPGENWKFGEAKDIPGYTLDLQKSDVDLDGVHSSLQDMLNGLSVNLKDFLNYINSQVFSGNVTAEKQYIHFVYTKNPVKAENVTVNYVDTEGKAIPNVSSQAISGNIGDSYDATTDKYKLAIAGYTLDETKLPSNAKGILSDQARTVNYVYIKINTLHTHKSEDSLNTTLDRKENGKKTDSNPESKNILPQTGDHEILSVIGMMFGILLILASLAITAFKRKRRD
jgi:LPXTG-motif cell wall-anchored protein